jgi:hypothetical protein
LVAAAFYPMSTENLDRLFAAANECDASDLHLVAGVPPAFRVNGEIILADRDALTEQEVGEMAAGLLNEQQKRKFDEEWELCISLLHPAAGRVRATFYRRNGHPEMSFRFCGEHIATREELGLPEKIDDLARKPNGLVLITGPTGAGKTTTLNYLVDMINSERRCKIVTIEDPIEFVHENKRAIVVQQEVLSDVRSFNRALIHVLRQDPDVIVVGEMRDFEAISTALTAAETGHSGAGDHALPECHSCAGTDRGRIRGQRAAADHSPDVQRLAGDYRAGTSARRRPHPPRARLRADRGQWRRAEPDPGKPNPPVGEHHPDRAQRGHDPHGQLPLRPLLQVSHHLRHGCEPRPPSRSHHPEQDLTRSCACGLAVRLVKLSS